MEDHLCKAAAAMQVGNWSWVLNEKLKDKNTFPSKKVTNSKPYYVIWGKGITDKIYFDFQMILGQILGI